MQVHQDYTLPANRSASMKNGLGAHLQQINQFELISYYEMMKIWFCKSQ